MLCVPFGGKFLHSTKNVISPCAVDDGGHRFSACKSHQKLRQESCVSKRFRQALRREIEDSRDILIGDFEHINREPNLGRVFSGILGFIVPSCWVVANRQTLRRNARLYQQCRNDG